jgi:DNA (cytosine-5)-methyltransferase 1
VLLEKFFFHVAEIRPQVFLMENVPPIVSDPEYKRLVREIREDGYTTSAAVLRYSDFGAATTRRRLFTVGFRDSGRWDAAEFFQRLDTYKQAFRTVRDKIAWLSSAPRGSVPDHDWSNVRTIEKYAERYRTGQYGWKQLSWDEPAPSFGSVAKTYILHPAAGKDGFPLRVLSVREVLSIMGFGRSFHFPTGTALHTRYRMAANAVSPTISAICGRVAMDMLTGLPAS